MTKISKLSQLAFVIIGAFACFGCSMFSPVKPVETNKYLLNSVPNVAKKRRHNTILLVLQPQTSPAFDTTQIVYSIRPHQIAYFSQNEWAETPSQMFEASVIQTLQDTKHFKAIVPRGYAGAYDYALYLQILDLKENFSVWPPRAEMKVRATLVKFSNSRKVATKEFSVSEPIMKITPYDGIMAANRANTILLRQLANFCVQHTN